MDLITTTSRGRYLGRARAILILDDRVNVTAAARTLVDTITTAKLRLDQRDPVRVKIEVLLTQLLARDKNPAVRAAEAATLYRIADEVLTPSHPLTQSALGHLTRFRRRAGIADDPIQEYRDVLHARVDEFGPHARKTSMARLNLAIALTETSDDPVELGEAADLALQEYETRSGTPLNPSATAPDGPTLSALLTYVRACLALHDADAPRESPGRIVDMARSAVSGLSKLFPADSSKLLLANTTLAGAYLAAGRADEARATLMMVELHRDRLPEEDAHVLPAAQARVWAASQNPTDWDTAVTYATRAVQVASRVWGEPTPTMVRLRKLRADVEAKVVAAT